MIKKISLILLFYSITNCAWFAYDPENEKAIDEAKARIISTEEHITELKNERENKPDQRDELDGYIQISENILAQYETELEDLIEHVKTYYANEGE